MLALGRRLKIRQSEKKPTRYFRNNNIKMYLTTIWCGGVDWSEMAPDKIMSRVMKLRFPCKVGCTVHRKEGNPCGVGLLWCGAGVYRL
jgi:hypothetical protein